MQSLLVNEISGVTTLYNFKNLQPIVTFKDSSEVKPNTLCNIKDDYIFWASSKKSVITTFEVSKNVQQPKKKVFPGKVTAAYVSDDGLFLCCGIGEDIILWDLISGDKLGSMSKHYECVTKVMITDNSRFIISAAMDGLVCAWSIPDIVNNIGGHHTEPYSSIQASFDIITDFWCNTNLGNGLKVYAGSKNGQISILDLKAKTVILMFNAYKQVTRLSVDICESMLFVGCKDGSLGKISLNKAYNQIQMYRNKDTSLDASSFNDYTLWKKKSHSLEISALCISDGGSIFVSGSHDKTLKVWNSVSMQCIKSITFKSGICNLKFACFPSISQNIDKKVSFDLPANFLASSDAEKDLNCAEKCILKPSGCVVDEIKLSEIDESLTAKSSSSESSINNLNIALEEITSRHKLLNEFIINGTI